MSKQTPQQIRAMIDERWAAAERGDYFALLGVPASATAADVKKAYIGLVKVLHPDRLSQHGLEDQRQRATKLFRVIGTAHEVLGNDQTREDFVAGRIEAERPDGGATSRAHSSMEESANRKNYR